MSDEAAWFGGDTPRTEDESRFLTALRAHGAGWRAAGLAPADTRVLARIVPLHVQLDVPGLPPAHANLQLSYWTSGARATGVEGSWGDGYLLDSTVAGGLEVVGVPAGPEELAGLAARWLATQLAEPVEQADWLDADGEVVASRWTLARTGVEIGRRGAVPRRLRRRTEPRVTRVR